jgi:hypothetical protein
MDWGKVNFFQKLPIYISATEGAYSQGRMEISVFLLFIKRHRMEEIVC